MNSIALAVFAARLGDLMSEVRTEFDDDEHRDFLVLAASALSKQIADRIEKDWNG